jgi:predicted amidohydrolase YtcJ
MKQAINIPLLKDHHNHFTLYSLFQTCLNLQEETNKERALKKLTALDRDMISVVLGWNSSYYGLTEDDLKPLPPVIIVNISLHQFLMSEAAETAVSEKYPDIVANYKDSRWYERNFPKMLIFLANQVEPKPGAFDRFGQYLLRNGIYYAEDMLLPGENVLNAIDASNVRERTAFWADMDTFKTLSPSAQARVEGIKLFTDGALGARTAALAHSYNDAPAAELLHTDDELYHLLKEAAGYGKAVAIHAIGDRATEQTVGMIQRLKENGVQFPQVRMEHIQFIREDVAVHARELGMIFSMQPNFSLDSINYTDRLPEYYVKTNNPFRMIIDTAGFVPGIDLILGSDGMPHGKKTALAASLNPPLPLQKLTLQEFIAAYCMPEEKTLDNCGVNPGKNE